MAISTWRPLVVDNPVTSLLISDPANWVGMKTVRELRQDAKLPVPNKADSEYKPIVRQERRFNPLKIPKKLQAELPFKSKPKLQAPSKVPIFASLSFAAAFLFDELVYPVTSCLLCAEAQGQGDLHAETRRSA